LPISLAIVAGALVVVILWRTGRRLQPPIETIVIPFVATMALRALAYAPTPWPMTFGIVYASGLFLP